MPLSSCWGVYWTSRERQRTHLQRRRADADLFIRPKSSGNRLEDVTRRLSTTKTYAFRFDAPIFFFDFVPLMYAALRETRSFHFLLLMTSQFPKIRVKMEKLDGINAQPLLFSHHLIIKYLDSLSQSDYDKKNSFRALETNNFCFDLGAEWMSPDLRAAADGGTTSIVCT